jgi:hypothetical protein
MAASTYKIRKFSQNILKLLQGAVSIGYGDTMLRDQLIEDLDRFLPV